MNEADLSLDAQWPGDPHQFCQTLLDVGFLDREEDGTYSIHDWKDHQPFAFYADERVQRAKELAAIRWGKKDDGIKQGLKQDDAEGMRDACGTQSLGNAPFPIPSPSPSPSPIPKKKNIFVEDSIEFRLASLLLSEIKKRKNDFRQPNLQNWGKQVDLMIRLDHRKPDRIEKVIKWIQKDSFWDSNILSTKKLREKFDQLEMVMGKGEKYI